MPGKRARPVLRGPRRGDASGLPDWRIWYYLLEAAGLDVQLVNARDVKNVPGRPKTDKLDAVWLAKLTEKGLLRPSFVPPAPIRRLRDYTRLRVDLTRERARYWQRLEKLLEDALIKVSSVASTLDTLSTRDMIEALIAGERDPRRLAELARGRMKAKRSELITALDGRFDDHHAELARMLLGQIDHRRAEHPDRAPSSTRIDEQLAVLRERRWADDPPDRRPGPPRPERARRRPDPRDRRERSATPPRWPKRLAPSSGSTRSPASASAPRRSILAEIGLDMSRFPTPAHLVSWAKLCPRTIQSGPVIRGGKTGKGNPYLKGALGEAAAAAAKTDTFLGERYRRLVKRRGKLKALVAVARSILVIIWHLLADPTARFRDLGPDYHTSRIDTERRIRNHIAQLTAHGLPRHPRTRRLTQIHIRTTRPGSDKLRRVLSPAHSPWVFSGQSPWPLAGPRTARENCVWVARATSEFPWCARARRSVGRGSLGSTELLLRARGSESCNYEAPPGRPAFSTSEAGPGRKQWTLWSSGVLAWMSTRTPWWRVCARLGREVAASRQRARSER